MRMSRVEDTDVETKADKYGAMKADKDGGTQADREVGDENATGGEHR
jgi:hypothetical protein